MTPPVIMVNRDQLPISSALLTRPRIGDSVICGGTRLLLWKMKKEKKRLSRGAKFCVSAKLHLWKGDKVEPQVGLRRFVHRPSFRLYFPARHSTSLKKAGHTSRINVFEVSIRGRSLSISSKVRPYLVIPFDKKIYWFTEFS